MNQQYWNRLAKNFAGRVFEIAGGETNGALAATVKKLSRHYKTAGDFGCGAGGTTPLLATYFDEVIAIDYAKKLLRRAQKRVQTDNVRFLAADLSAKKPPAVTVDAAFCINALLHPNAKKRRRITETVYACTRRGGAALVVAPALESYMRTYQVLVGCRAAQGMGRKKAVRAVVPLAQKEVHSLVEGIVDVGGTPTKHYMHDELVQQLADAGFAVATVARVEFPWSEVLDDLPQDLQKFRPWDWLAVASK